MQPIFCRKYHRKCNGRSMIASYPVHELVKTIPEKKMKAFMRDIKYLYGRITGKYLPEGELQEEYEF